MVDAKNVKRKLYGKLDDSNNKKRIKSEHGLPNPGEQDSGKPQTPISYSGKKKSSKMSNGPLNKSCVS